MTEPGIMGALKKAQSTAEAHKARVDSVQTKAKAIISERLGDVFGDGSPETTVPFFQQMAAELSLGLRWKNPFPSGEIPLRLSPKFAPPRQLGSDANEWTASYDLDIQKETLSLRLRFDRWVDRLGHEPRSLPELESIIGAPSGVSAETESHRFAAAFATCFGTVQDTANMAWSPPERQRNAVLAELGQQISKAFGAPPESTRVELLSDGGYHLRFDMAVPGAKSIVGQK